MALDINKIRIKANDKGVKGIIDSQETIIIENINAINNNLPFH